MRLHELARDLGCTTEDLKNVCTENDYEFKSSSSNLSSDTEFALRQHFRRVGLASGELERSLGTFPLAIVSKEFQEGFSEVYNARFAAYNDALTRLNQNLKSLFVKLLEPTDLPRCRIDDGRVKSAERLLAKARRPNYWNSIKSPEDIFDKIDDIVATRITCNNLSDANMVLSLLESYCTKTASDAPMFVVAGSRNDYVSSPKMSGYRALHLNVDVPAPDGASNLHVSCEIQIRTLLQHAWGELTHEDTYKPEVRLSPLAAALAKRLATALAVLDEIAEDLRFELDNPPQSRDDLDAVTDGNDDQGFRRPDDLSLAGPLLPTEDRLKFERHYVVGRKLVGTVQYVRDDYALVMDNLATTCILHASSFADRLGGPIDVTRYVHLGQTVETEIIESRWGVKPRVALKLLSIV